MIISKFWEQAHAPILKNALNIIIIAHVQEPRGHMNSRQLQCSLTERFSIDEFNEIYQGIVAAGYFVQAIYFNEIDFIEDYIGHPDRYKNILVYTLARNGLGNNKKTIIPSFCELMGLQYTSSASLPCALARNKYYFSSLFHTHNIPVPKSWLYLDKNTWLNGEPENGIKVICKPASESASQGINESQIITTSSNFSANLIGTNYIVQEYIEGFECEVPVFKVGDKIYVLPPVGIDLHGKTILDEDSSENSQYSFYKLDNILSPETISSIQKNAEKAFNLLQMDVYGRIDFRVGKNGQPFIFDVSTTPYTTKHSSFAYAFEHLGFEYCDIYRAIISSALMRK